MSGRGGRGRGRGRGGRGGGRGRGRGRGASRGRGSSRGRGAVRGGFGRGRGYNRSTSRDSNAGEAGQPQVLSVETSLKEYFTGTASFEQHFDAQEENWTRYAAGMAVLEDSGVEVNQNAKVRALAAAWARRDHQLADSFLTDRERFGMVEVLKAITLLDSSRRIRVYEKKLKRLQIATGGKVKPKVMGKFKSDIDNLTALKPHRGSASGAVCKHVARWVRAFSREELEYYALHYPVDPWRRLADICHFNPERDFPTLPWFLPFCFGKPAPEGTLVHRCRDVTAENVNDLLKEFPLPYSHVKDHKGVLTEESKGRIGLTDKLDQILWWYEELKCPEVDKFLLERIEKGEPVTLPNGKLLERLLTIKMIRENIPERGGYYGRTNQQRTTKPTTAHFIHKLIPIAQERMGKISLPLESPVVVIGDRSGSMEVAIRTSTIIASLLTAICSARLVFFDDKNMEAPFIPSNIEEVLELAVTINTGGCTVPAVSLWPFYEKKEVVKTFLMVTDEEENGSHQGHRFAPLFKMYREEVYPAKLVFVSFLRGQHQQGQMMRELQQLGVTENIMHFNFNQDKPDLTKLDKLFGLLSSETADFEQQVRKKEASLRADGVNRVFQDLNLEAGAGNKGAAAPAGGASVSQPPADTQGDVQQAAVVTDQQPGVVSDQQFAGAEAGDGVTTSPDAPMDTTQPKADQTV